jgi:hypothetical protein
MPKLPKVAKIETAFVDGEIQFDRARRERIVQHERTKPGAGSSRVLSRKVGIRIVSCC